MTVRIYSYSGPAREENRWSRALGVSGSPMELVEQARDGFPVEAFDRFSALADVPREALAAAVHTTTRTIARRREANKPLDPAASERLIRIAQLYEKASEVLGDDELAKQWMLTPRGILGGQSPFRLAASEIGVQEVEDLLLRVEHGVFY